MWGCDDIHCVPGLVLWVCDGYCYCGNWGTFGVYLFCI